jgi:acetyl-CoA acyltransferase
MKAVVAAYARSPFHFAKKGRLAGLRPEAMAAQVVQGLLTRCGVDPALLEDVMLGCAYAEAAQGNNLARIVGLLAGLPVSIGGVTINRRGGSSMQAVHSAAAQIEAGMAEAVMCVGVESMTMVPQAGLNLPPNPTLKAASEACVSMGQTAENVAVRWKVSRIEQEQLALQSHRRAAAARSEGRLAEEIVPLRLEDGSAVAEDGCIRPDTTLEALAALKPAFRPDGVVTAGTSSPLADGAAALLVSSDVFASRHRMAPLARVRSFSAVGVDPAVMGIGPVPATRKALHRAGLMVADLDVVELHESFASQVLACIRELHFDPERVNRDGGGLAIGDPLGASGARIVGKAALLLGHGRGRFALATQCIGGGQGIATVLERL